MAQAPNTDPVNSRPGHSLLSQRIYAPGVREEAVIRLGLPLPMSRTLDPSPLTAKVELPIEELEIEEETLWRMNALAFAAFQRVAHDQAEILAGMIAGLSRTLPSVDDPVGKKLPSPMFSAAQVSVMQMELTHGLNEIAKVLSEACRELTDIRSERLLTWVSVFGQLFGPK